MKARMTIWKNLANLIKIMSTTSVKLKFRESMVEGKEGRLFFQVIRNRCIRQITLPYMIYPDEWSEDGRLAAGSSGPDYIAEIARGVSKDRDIMERAVASLDARGDYTADDVVEKYNEMAGELQFTAFTGHIIAHLRKMGKDRTAGTYTSAMNSFMTFRKGKRTFLNDMTDEEMQLYQSWLRNNGCGRNTISFYMRILRAIYNRAVERGLIDDEHPFRHVFTGYEKTKKRAVSVSIIRKIKELDLPEGRKSLRFARDIFLFSFYTRGMSFVDIAYLKKDNIRNGFLVYRRRKTGQQLTMKWEPAMKKIAERYQSDSEYIFPIVSGGDDDRRKYNSAMVRVNKALKTIGTMLHLPAPLTMYVARHSWATAARVSNIPISVISEGLGHDSEETTQIYLASIDNSVVDKANSRIIGLLGE